MSSVAIFADRVVVGPADVVIDDGAVLVDHDVVRAVGTHRHVDRVADAQTPRHSYPGATILPGLIDSHVHLAFDSGPDPVGAFANADPAALLLARDGEPSTTTFARRGHDGTRSGRPRSTDHGLREAIARGTFAGPKILAATTPLTSPGGHCGFLGGEVSTDSDIRQQITRNAKAGANLIKVMASGGAPTPLRSPHVASTIHRRAAGCWGGCWHCCWVCSQGVRPPPPIWSQRTRRSPHWAGRTATGLVSGDGVGLEARTWARW